MTAKRWPRWGQVLTQLLALALVFVHQTQVKAKTVDAAPGPTGPHDSAKDFAIGSPLGALRLSSDRKRYAAIIRRASQALVVARFVAGGDYRIMPNTDDRIVDFNRFHWIYNDRFAFSQRRLYCSYLGGNPFQVF